MTPILSNNYETLSTNYSLPSLMIPNKTFKLLVYRIYLLYYYHTTKFNHAVEVSAD